MTLLNVNGFRIHYELQGANASAPVVMLSNSLASRLTMWNAQAAALLAAGYRVLRYDHRGHGDSEVTPGPYAMELLAADAVALLDALAIERVHFCGLSMGGMVGQQLGTSYADRLLSLMLCATAAHMGPAELWDTRIAAVRDGGMAAVADATIDRWFTKAGQQRLQDPIRDIRAAILATDPRGFCACCAGIRDMDQRESIRAITTRTLVLVGEQDPGTTVAVTRFIHERIPGSEFCVISNAAHFVNVEQAGEFNTALLTFLEEA